ncbi:MAG: ABC transporter ATP-binding protein [Lachnospiraceae bacterium]|nr:ABC transporter ATP-binding protein [Lachnospiraceae bacterium]
MIFGKHINKYYLKYWWLLLLGMAALVLVDFAQLKIPEFYRMVINGITGETIELDGAAYAFDMDFLLDRICLPMIFVILSIVLGRFLWRIGFFGSAVRVNRDLRDEMFTHAAELSQEYYSESKIGGLMSLFTNDLETIRDCFGSGILTAVDAACLGAMSFIKMLRMNALLTLFSLLPMTVMFAIGMLVGTRMTKKWDERQAKFSELSDFSQESFTGIAVIKAFAKEVKELLAFRKLNKENEKVNVEYVRIATVMEILITLFVQSVVAVILGYGGYLVYTGVFNGGELVEFIGYFTSIIWPIMAIAILIEQHARGSASLKRISEFLDAEVVVKDGEKAGLHADPAIGGKIEFKHLSFTYPGSEVEVLHDVSFTIERGENVGIIGRTGSGKTTVVDLLTRTYNVPDGTLFVDGIDVNEMPIRALRKHLAYVPQDNFLFSDTIANNIAFAFESDNDMEAIRHAAKLSAVDENIEEFPEKYETVLGERGVTVSGGQKQRISIARALMKDAEILILDDSVSAVDTKTEKVILEGLLAERKGKTTVLIAHRVSTVEHMDKVLFLEEGRVLDMGTHEELLGRCRAYRETVEAQKLEDERKERA